MKRFNYDCLLVVSFASVVKQEKRIPPIAEPWKLAMALNVLRIKEYSPLAVPEDALGSIIFPFDLPRSHLVPEHSEHPHPKDLKARTG